MTLLLFLFFIEYYIPFYNARNAPGPQDPNQPDLSGFEFPSSDSDSVDSSGGTMKNKNNKRK
jgi:hypothetical protein